MRYIFGDHDERGDEIPFFENITYLKKLFLRSNSSSLFHQNIRIHLMCKISGLMDVVRTADLTFAD